MTLTILTNAVTDMIIKLSYEDWVSIGFRRGFGNRISKCDKEVLAGIINSHPKKIIPGGSPANVAFNAAKYGIETTLIGTVGNDELGRNYIKCVENAKIDSLIRISEGASGICYVFITPDGERTFTTNIGNAGEYNFDFSRLSYGKIFHTSGFELYTNPDKVKEAIYYAKQKNSMISFDLADPAMIIREKESFQYVLKKTDILFASVEEASALIGQKEESLILEELLETCSTVALKKGSKGSVVANHEGRYDIPVIPVHVINTCGAGDAYAAGFIFGYLKGYSLGTCGHMGSFAASKVCEIEESHL